MGFCTRCGEITGSSGRCKCGGTSKESASRALFDGSGSDRWQQRYVARSTPPKASPVPTTAPSATSAGPASSPVRPGALLPAPQPSPTKLAQSFLNVDSEGELSSVFGSVLSPKDHWQCAACATKFRQEEVIYPHPEAEQDPSLGETFFCRQCFADRFRKGDCKKCKYAVLSDAPFVKHDGNVWHKECYTCSYCEDPATEPVIDFAGMPSCEACFDAEAYKTCGIPPSPHLGQSEFFKPAAALPAPSKWGRPSVAGSPSSAAAARTNVWSAHGPAQHASSPSARAPTSLPSKLSRLQLERNQSPIAPSLDELRDKLRRVGLQTSAAPSTPVPQTSSTAPPRPALSRRPLPELPRESARPSGPSRSGSPVKTAPSTTRLPTSPVKPSTATPLGSPAFPDSCAICAQPLGDARHVELSSSSSVRMHSSCFRCGACSKELAGGRFVEAEARWWHRECAPAPQTYRTIIPRLQETYDDPNPAAQTPSSSLAQAPVEEKSPSCFACGRQLGVGPSITVPRSGRSFHEKCFCCAGCSRPFAGEKGFVEQEGLPYHQQCARPTLSPSPARPKVAAPLSPSALPTSRSIRDLPSPTSLPPKYSIPSSSPTKPSVEPSLFSRRPRPPAGLGGLLICAGCSVRATERETVLGPRGRRYHPKCLKCRACSRKLDSECRVGDDGLLRCEACRKTASRLPLQGNVNTSRSFTTS